MTIPSKTMKFEGHLADMILAGEKTSTWRLFDDKDLKTGDIVTFVRRPELTAFAIARLTDVVEKKFGDFTPEDFGKHESYSSKEEMYQKFSECYGRPVDSQTKAKIVYFDLIKIIE